MASPTPSENPDITDNIKSRIFQVTNYWFYGRSCDKVRIEFKKSFNTSEAPTNKTILANVEKFNLYGSILDRQKGNSGRPLSIVTEENTEKVDEYFTENPSTSTRRASLELDISRTSLQRILKTKIKMWPYKIQIHQELTEHDMERRLAFSRKMLRHFSKGEIEHKKIWFSDEAHFWLSGYVNKQNHRFWAKENPRIFRTTQMKPQRITVWCAICSSGIIGPIFIHTNVNGASYQELLENEFIPAAYGLDAVDDYWFMQDGALPHRTNAAFELLNEHFTGRVIGLGYEDRYEGGIDWPPYSPDLNPCDFFLWGYLKDTIYKNGVKSIEDIKAKLVETIQKIQPSVLESVVGAFENRLRAVIEAEGAHIENFVH